MSGDVTTPAARISPTAEAVEPGPSERIGPPSAAPPQGRRSKLKGGLWLTFLRLLVAVAFCVVWALISGPLGLVDPFWVSNPRRVVDALGDQFGSPDLFTAVRYTMWESVAGLVIGSVSGIVAGILLASNRTVDKVLSPYATLLNTIPRFALAPLFIVYFGIGATSKIVLVVSMVFFVLMVNTYGGYHSVDRDLRNLMTVLGASRQQIYMKLYLPTITPWIFTGLHLALAYALASAVVGEMISAQYGLGVLISRESGLFNISGVFALLIILSVLSLALDLLIRAVERRVLRWRYVGDSAGTL